jgi:hypothetical protein
MDIKYLAEIIDFLYFTNMRDNNNENKLPKFSRDGIIHVTDEEIIMATHMTGAILSLFIMVLPY